MRWVFSIRNRTCYKIDGYFNKCSDCIYYNQYLDDCDFELVNSSYGVKMFINGVYIGCQNSTDNRMKELINSELEKHEIPKHEPKSMTESRKRKIEKNKQMLEHSKKVRDFLNKYYAGERTYTYLGKGENFPLDYEPIV